MFGEPRILTILVVTALVVAVIGYAALKAYRCWFCRTARKRGYPPRPDDVSFEEYRAAIVEHRRRALDDQVQSAADRRMRRMDRLIAQFPDPAAPDLHRADDGDAPAHGDYGEDSRA